MSEGDPAASANFGLEGPNHEGGVDAVCEGGRVHVRPYGDRALGGDGRTFGPEEFARAWGHVPRGAVVVEWLRAKGWLR